MNIRFQGINQILYNLREGSIALIDAQSFPQQQATLEGVAEGRLAAAVEDPDFLLFGPVSDQFVEKTITNPNGGSASPLRHIWQHYSATDISPEAKAKAFQKFEGLLHTVTTNFRSIPTGLDKLAGALKAYLP